MDTKHPAMPNDAYRDIKAEIQVLREAIQPLLEREKRLAEIDLKRKFYHDKWVEQQRQPEFWRNVRIFFIIMCFFISACLLFIGGMNIDHYGGSVSSDRCMVVAVTLFIVGFVMSSSLHAETTTEKAK